MKIRVLGRQDYAACVEAMRAFTEARDAATEDELWLVEHDPVYTQGLAGRPEHVLDPRGIPIVPTNRGGQVTYHGPGQVVAYPLVDLKRLGIYVKEYVYRLEHAVLKTLEAHGVTGHRVAGALLVRHRGAGRRRGRAGQGQGTRRAAVVVARLRGPAPTAPP